MLGRISRKLGLTPARDEVTPPPPPPVDAGAQPAPEAPPDPRKRYEDWFATVVRTWTQAPNTWPATSWTPGTVWGDRVLAAMRAIERDFAADLIETLEREGLHGPIVEFGVFQGEWLADLIRIVEARGLARQFIGFDSFEGLPPPAASEDLACFAEGQFAADLASVAARLGAATRPNLRLVKGWFSDTLGLPEVQALGGISYARVDCDLYGPALECLRYLGPRMADGAVLVLDDWTFDMEKGETRAFAEWLPEVPGLRFEYLCFNGIGHLYLRVRHATRG